MSRPPSLDIFSLKNPPPSPSSSSSSSSSPPTFFPSAPIIGEEKVRDVASFHYGPIGRDNSEKMFAKETRPGTCIFRQRQVEPTQHVLTILYPEKEKNRLIHVLIYEKNGSFSLQNGRSFPNLTAVLKNQEKRGQEVNPFFIVRPKKKKERKIVPLTPWQFSPSEGKWCSSSPSPSSSPPSLTLTEMSVITFNVWFSKFEWEKRLGAVLKILKEKDADFVCFQEVTPRFFGPLLADEWIRENYFLTETSEYYFCEFYGTLMLSKFPFQRIQRYQDLPTTQGRDFLTATFDINGEIFTCSTIHLESCAPSFTLRKRQLDLIFETLKDSNTALFMGDMNMAPSYPENQSIHHDYIDVWPFLKCSGSQPHLHPLTTEEPEENPGFTEDTTINTMRYNHSGRRHRHVRYDRVFVRSKAWRATEIEILGADAIGEDLFPSDHFGLFSKFRWTS